MADFFSQYRDRQDANDNQRLRQASGDAAWANFFESTPPVEKLRAQANLDDLIANGIQRKQELLAQSDLKAQALIHNQQLFEEKMAQAPLRRQLLEAQVAATGATERRKAEEARLQAEHTAGLNRGLLDIYKSGAAPGTPEFQAKAVDVLAKYPHAHLEHVAELGKMAGFSSDLTPEQYVAKAVEIKRLWHEKGLPGEPAIRSYGGKPIGIEGPATMVTIKEGDKTIRRPLGTDAQEAAIALKVEHDKLEKDINASSGKKPDPAKIAELNSVKQKLGYDMLDPATGAVIPKAAPATAQASGPKPPAVGEVRNGWKFKGGNPADKSNWEQ